jgi:Tol biopolymer transport system component
VVSTAGQGLAWTDVNRGVADSLTTDSADRAPVFSPDGKYIAVTYRQDTHWDIHRLNADGTGRVRLTKTPLYNIVDSTRQWNNVAPTFSPDGSEIAFLTDRTGRWEVWVMNVDGANQRPMFPNAINDQLPIEYAGNDERSLQWGL